MGSRPRGGSGGRAPRGTALGRFRVAVHVVRAHGLLNTLRAAAGRVEAAGREEEEEEEEVVGVTGQEARE